MASWSGEEVFKGVEKWLKTRRDEKDPSDHTPGGEWAGIDTLLDELRDSAAEGWLPWQRLNSDE